MFKLTCITLDDGQHAVFLNGHCLVSDDVSGHKFSLGEILERLSRLPGVQTERVKWPVSAGDWEWFDVANTVFPAPGLWRREMTVSGMIARLQQHPLDALCTGTFWLADDFLSLDDTLDNETIEAAMALADECHDANIGFNWEHLQWAIDEAKK